MNSIGMIDAFIDWAYSFGHVEGLGIVFGSVTVFSVSVMVITAGGMDAYSAFKLGASKRLLQTLDSCKTEVFTTQQQCLAKGYAPKVVERSLRTIRRQVNSSDTCPHYATRKECVDNHGAAEVLHITAIPPMTTVVMSGKVVVPIIIPGCAAHDIYYPPVVGWQAAAHNIAKCAVPLYASKRPGYGARYDGKLIRLPSTKPKPV